MSHSDKALTGRLVCARSTISQLAAVDAVLSRTVDVAIWPVNVTDADEYLFVLRVSRVDEDNSTLCLMVCSPDPDSKSGETFKAVTDRVLVVSQAAVTT